MGFLLNLYFSLYSSHFWFCHVFSEYDFDNVDGLTFRQFYNSFCLSDDYHLIISAYVDRTNKLDPERGSFTARYNFRCAHMYKGCQELDTELSAAYEDTLISMLSKDCDYDDDGLFIEHVAKTFCSRYRGKSERDIQGAAKIRKLFHI